MAIGDVLMSQRRWGSTRCRKFLAMFRISETKSVGSLTERQRRELSARLSGEVVVDPFERVAEFPDVKWMRMAGAES